jgi:ribA/ribD-fused uncharacterized protein
VNLKVDKLHIDGQVYSITNLHELPRELRPENIATKITDKVALFASKHSPLSNFYSQSQIKIDHQFYCSTEQYYQSQKAMFFDDDTTAAKIMTETDPYKISALGKRISKFDSAKWEPKIREVLLKANREKFAQDWGANHVLKSTGDLPIGEATKDPTFGIGLHINDPLALEKSKWSGNNLFGEILEQIRGELNKE